MSCFTKLSLINDMRKKIKELKDERVTNIKIYIYTIYNENILYLYYSILYIKKTTPLNTFELNFSFQKYHQFSI